VRVGEKVVLDSSRSRDRDGRIVLHLWDLNGDGVFERSSGRHARLRHAFPKAGTHRVAVAVIDDDGGYAVRRARVKAVRASAGAPAAPAPAPTSENIGSGHALGRAATAETHAPRVHRAKTATTHPAPTVTAASSSTVVIKNFAFSPSSVTINEGDTVTWRNDDSATHTATADDGTFDTGGLTTGTTGQYRFEKAGTFAYHCTPHPSMTGTVIVKAAGSTDSDSGGSSPGSDTSSGSGSDGNDSGDSSLPHTGLQIGALALAGLVLLGSGAALRRRLART
jgi:LPXTG-motif cell wall-anchored protein